MSTPTQEKWARWIETIRDNGLNLSTFEEEFMEGLYLKVEKYGDNIYLSEKQVDILEHIYTDRCP